MPRYTLLPLTTVLLLATACGGGGGGNASPDGAIAGSVAALRDNDVSALINRFAPPEVRSEMQVQWERNRSKGMSDQEKAGFGMTMTQLTAEGAEDSLLLLAKPQLAEIQAQVQQTAGMITMVGGMAIAGQGGSEAEQQQAMETLAGVGAWLSTVDLTDETKLKQAIGIVCNTARKLDVKTADQFTALSFDQLLGKAGVALGGVKQAVAVYGLDLDGILDSVQVGSPSVTGSTATVPVTVTMFGKTMTAPATLNQVDGHWYPQQRQPPLTSDEISDDL